MNSLEVKISGGDYKIVSSESFMLPPDVNEAKIELDPEDKQDMKFTVILTFLTDVNQDIPGFKLHPADDNVLEISVINAHMTVNSLGFGIFNPTSFAVSTDGKDNLSISLKIMYSKTNTKQVDYTIYEHPVRKGLSDDSGTQTAKKKTAKKGVKKRQTK